MKLFAKATRTGSWWAVEVPDVPGAFTQTKRLDQVPDMVADAVSLLLEIPAHEVEVHVQPILPDNLDADLNDLFRLVQEANELQHKASERARDCVSQLKSRGLSVRDIGQVMGLSPQRISQLAPRVPAKQPDAAPHQTVSSCGPAASTLTCGS